MSNNLQSVHYIFIHTALFFGKNKILEQIFMLTIA